MLFIIGTILLVLLIAFLIGMIRPRYVIPFGNPGRGTVILIYFTPFLLIIGTILYFLRAKEPVYQELPENVTRLGFYDKGLKALPPNITDYENLVELNLKSNHIRHLDKQTFRRLPKLKYLNLHNNPIKELPEWLGDLQLESLTLDGTDIEYIPDNLLKNIPEISYADTPLANSEAANN
ncbi:MAG: leucine-rich repeat domain-containing protein [Cyclobacteriaceae bacterium]